MPNKKLNLQKYTTYFTSRTGKQYTKPHLLTTWRKGKLICITSMYFKEGNFHIPKVVKGGCWIRKDLKTAQEFVYDILGGGWGDNDERMMRMSRYITSVSALNFDVAIIIVKFLMQW